MSIHVTFHFHREKRSSERYETVQMIPRTGDTVVVSHGRYLVYVIYHDLRDAKAFRVHVMCSYLCEADDPEEYPL